MLVGLDPVMLVRVSHAAWMEPERDEPQGSHVEPGGLDRAGQVGMARVTPLLAGLNDGDFPRNNGPEPSRSDRDNSIASQKTTAGGPLFNGQHDELDRSAVARGGRAYVRWDRLCSDGDPITSDRLFPFRGELQTPQGNVDAHKLRLPPASTGSRPCRCRCCSIMRFRIRSRQKAEALR